MRCRVSARCCAWVRYPSDVGLLCSRYLVQLDLGIRRRGLALARAGIVTRLELVGPWQHQAGQTALLVHLGARYRISRSRRGNV